MRGQTRDKNCFGEPTWLMRRVQAWRGRLNGRTDQSTPRRFHQPSEDADCADGAADHAGRQPYQGKREQEPQRQIVAIKREVHDGTTRITVAGSTPKNAQLSRQFRLGQTRDFPVNQPDN